MDSPETAPTEIQGLRDDAASRLRDAARCDDPERRDALLREALTLLDRARVLRDRAAGRGEAGPPTTRTPRCGC